MTANANTSIWQRVRASERRNASGGKYWIPVEIYNSLEAFLKGDFLFYFFKLVQRFLYAQKAAAVTTLNLLQEIGLTVIYLILTQ